MRTGKQTSQSGASDIGGFLNVGSLPGSVFVLPHYDSGSGKDTEITIANSGPSSATVHLFFIATTGFLSKSSYVTVLPGSSEMVKASILDSGQTGLVVGMSSNLVGQFVSYNYLSASARFYDATYDGVFPAFIFKSLVGETTGKVTLDFDGLYLESQPYSVGFLNVRSDSFVAFANLSGVLTTGLDLITSLTVKTQSDSGENSVFSNPNICQKSGVISTLFPSITNLSTNPTGRLFANCSFGMIINKVEALSTITPVVIDDGSRISVRVTIPLKAFPSVGGDKDLRNRIRS